MAALASCPSTLNSLDFHGTQTPWPTYFQYLPFPYIFTSVNSQAECDNLCDNFDENLLETTLCPNLEDIKELPIPPYSVTPNPTQTLIVQTCFAGQNIQRTGSNWFSPTFNTCWCGPYWSGGLVCQYEVCNEPNPSYLIPDHEFDVGISGWTPDNMDNGNPSFPDDATLTHHFVGGTEYALGIAGEQQGNGHSGGRPAAHHPFEVVSGQNYIIKGVFSGSGNPARHPVILVGTAPKSSSVFGKALDSAAGTIIGQFTAPITGTLYVTIFCELLYNSATIVNSLEVYACG